MSLPDEMSFPDEIKKEIEIALERLVNIAPPPEMMADITMLLCKKSFKSGQLYAAQQIKQMILESKLRSKSNRWDGTLN